MDLPTNLINSSIRRGAIFYCSKVEGVEHGKFIVVIGENKDEYLGVFFINSHIHNSIKSKPELMDLQIYLNQKDYDFLDYYSFLGCNSIIPIKKDRLSNDIQNKTSEIKGVLTENDLGIVLEKIRNSDLFTKIQKDTFFK